MNLGAKRLTRWIVLSVILGIVAFGTLASATDSAPFTITKVTATSFVPAEESRYTFCFKANEVMNLSPAINDGQPARIKVDFPAGFKLTKGAPEAENPGCTLAYVQYRNSIKDRYSIANGNVSVNTTGDSTSFEIELTGRNKNIIDPGVDVYLTVPGVINSGTKGTQRINISVTDADGKCYSESSGIVLGDAPAEAPKGLRLEAIESGMIEAVWNSVYGAARYQLYYSLTPDGYYIQACDFGREPEPGEQWGLTETNCSFAGVGNGGLEPGRTYYFKVRAGNAYGFGKFSPVNKVTTPEVRFINVIPEDGKTVVSTNRELKAIVNTKVIVTDLDKIQIFNRETGEPLDKQVSVVGKNIKITAQLADGVEYQIVFYEHALESLENPKVFNRVFGWSFNTKAKYRAGR